MKSKNAKILFGLSKIKVFMNDKRARWHKCEDVYFWCGKYEVLIPSR